MGIARSPSPAAPAREKLAEPLDAEEETLGSMLERLVYRRNVALEALQQHGVDVEHFDPLGWERSAPK